MWSHVRWGVICKAVMALGISCPHFLPFNVSKISSLPLGWLTQLPYASCILNLPDLRQHSLNFHYSPLDAALWFHCVSQSCGAAICTHDLFCRSLEKGVFENEVSFTTAFPKFLFLWRMWKLRATSTVFSCYLSSRTLVGFMTIRFPISF